MRAETFVENAWYGAGLSADFKARDLQSHVIAGKPIVLWRDDDGTVVAFDDRCVHKRMQLSAGRFLDDGTVECAYHGLCYDSTGTCVKIPSQPGQPISSKAKLKPHRLVEQDGIVWLWPGDPDKIGNYRPPRSPEIDSDDWVTVSSERLPVGANYRLLIENLLDITHFYPLHEGNIGDYENSEIPVEFVEEIVDGNQSIMSVREVEGYTQPPMLVDWLEYEIVDRYHTHKMMNPGLTRVEMRVAPPGELGTDKDRGYVPLSHPYADRRHPLGVAVDRQHPGRPEPSQRSVEIGRRTFRRNLPRGRRGGPLGPGETAGKLRLRRRRLQRAASEVGPVGGHRSQYPKRP